MPIYVYIIVILGWLGWFSAFLFSRRRTQGAAKINKQARWGMLLEGLAFGVLWQGRFWDRSPSWRLAPATLLLASASALSWSGVKALGSQWRLDAGLNPDHQLIRFGPYSIVRHPIYASMLCLLLGTGLILAPWYLFAPAVVLFLVGTEIRVRIEDRLLESKFGEEFLTYQGQVPAYIPWVR
jgi:protein-S-isoprenylcysteine O-methyltransferase Ste14